MKVPKIVANNAHRKWCMEFQKEQNKTTRMVRNLLKKSNLNNPFSNNANIDNILKRYEKSFW